MSVILVLVLWICGRHCCCL